ncbi:HSF-type DNA-binding-domain-containing protein [Naematelia encephala]|uniref:HSF-type DNA-binding-domain-containing protein n=1 Tax=Naematelia encephala TaxID=71784 RepID=A0A1Y2BL45_9TREE|nr:HSF-type DNA-binding-domain-containing protein [Naematelia encephala]
MSRIPPQPPYNAHPPPAPGYYHPSMTGQPPGPPMQTYQGNDGNVYAYHRPASGGYDYGQPAPAPAGPSRGNGYAYPPPVSLQRVSSNNPVMPTGPGGRGQLPPPTQANGWSSIHPAATPSARRPDTARSATGGPVKLEDLVSQVPPQAGRSNAAPPAGGLTSHPLSNDPSKSSVGNADGGGGGGQSAGAGGGSAQGPSEFIKKLYKMLEEESAMYGKGKAPGERRGEGAKRGSVGWGKGGASFVVWDMNEFTTKVLPQTFRHSNFSSFVRQLNKYGFSKIKHTDEETGQIKENVRIHVKKLITHHATTLTRLVQVWEFQHPNFQAGRRSDLDSIKRKVVAPKKGADAEDTSSPRPLMGEDPSRLSEMETRVINLEDRLAKAMDEVRDARNREMGMMGLFREVLGHLGQIERESGGSPMGDMKPSARIQHLYQVFDSISQPSISLPPIPSMTSFPPAGLPAQTFTPSVRFHPQYTTGGGAGFSQVSPHSTPSHEGQSPSGSRTSASASGGRGSGARAQRTSDQMDEQVDMAAPAQSRSQGQPDPDQTLYNGEPLDVTPMFAETPTWLTENAPLPRKSSDGSTLRLMFEALSGQGQMRFDTMPDPLDTSASASASTSAQPDAIVPSTKTMAASSSATTATSTPAVQESPFGTLILPPQAAPKTTPAALRLRRSTTLATHWTQTPRILVVEDDVVYRQLSSKFLEKFGCVTETVDDAQGAIERMNKTKYDLVLMDIFFGPSMDGRKATSLIRQFDIYTPIISMTSNAQPQDVDSYLQSGMNDVLAKPFTKYGLFGILDKHLIHLKAIQLSAEVPRSVGLPPLSDQGVVDAVATGALMFGNEESGEGEGEGGTVGMRNPLAAMGWSDDTYQLVLHQFMATGAMPELTSIVGNTDTGTIGTSLVFGESTSFRDRKRSFELLGGDGAEWTPAPTPGSTGLETPVTSVGGSVGSAGQASVGLDAVRSKKPRNG